MAALTLVASAHQAQPILERTGAILTYGGTPVRLVGYGDYGMVAEASFDYVQFLDLIADGYGPDHVRVWVNYHWPNALNPFPGGFGTFDLESQSEAYYDRLRAFVCYAQQKGVIVQVCLFDAVALTPEGSRWPYSPYNDAMNPQPYLGSCSQYDDVGTVWWHEVRLVPRHIGLEPVEPGRVTRFGGRAAPAGARGRSLSPVGQDAMQRVDLGRAGAALDHELQRKAGARDPRAGGHGPRHVERQPRPRSER